MQKNILLLVVLWAVGSAHAAIGGTENCRVIVAGKAEMPGETLTWKGPCVNGYAEGNGVLLRSVSGRQIGSFEGRLAQGMMADGYEKRPDGSQYEGQYRDGLRHGKGTWIDKSGSRYDGQWEADKRAGKGIATYATGGNVDGEWLNDFPVATSKAVFAGGRVGSVAELQKNEGNEVVGVRTYGLRSEEFSLDRFDDKITSGSPVPHNKSYAEMTPQQQRYIRKSYPMLHPDDVPPYPEKGIEQMIRWVSRAQSIVGEVGEFRSIADVDASGKVTAITVFESPDDKIASFIKNLLFHQIFTPARCSGTPCAMRYPFDINFTMRGDSRFH